MRTGVSCLSCCQCEHHMTGVTAVVPLNTDNVRREGYFIHINTRLFLFIPRLAYIITSWGMYYLAVISEVRLE